MALRRAVSLVEVLVATVLLAVGVSGCLSTLFAASRLRENARAREALADAVHERLSWFEALACTAPDTTGTPSADDRVRVTWHTSSSANARALELDARTFSGPREQRLALTTSVPCLAG